MINEMSGIIKLILYFFMIYGGLIIFDKIHKLLSEITIGDVVRAIKNL